MGKEAERSVATFSLIIRRIVFFVFSVGFLLASIATMVGAYESKDFGLAGLSLGLLGFAAFTFHVGKYGRKHKFASLHQDRETHEEQKRKYGWRW